MHINPTFAAWIHVLADIASFVSATVTIVLYLRMSVVKQWWLDIQKDIGVRRDPKP